MKKVIIIFLLFTCSLFAQIKVKESHRIGTSVNIQVFDDKNQVIYDRYIPIADWDKDNKAEAAKISDYLSNVQASPVIVVSGTAITITLTKDEITKKLGEIALAKAGS